MFILLFTGDKKVLKNTNSDLKIGGCCFIACKIGAASKKNMKKTRTASVLKGNPVD